MNRTELLEIAQITKDYKIFSNFEANYNMITIPEFDYAVVNNLSLFVVYDNYDFDSLDQMIQKIDYVMPSIKRIFAKPIIHLTDNDEVLPVETVRLINNKTLNHIATHSELWDDITSDGIKPLKLMTKVYQDNYCIYENMVFARTIDSILGYTKRQMKIIKEMLYSGKILEMNLLERVNHPNYFLALGKLHTGYIRNFSKNYEVINNYYKKLSYDSEILKTRLKRNVYRYNRGYQSNFPLHNSNILQMQKDYHRVYHLLKHFKKIKKNLEILSNDEFLSFKENYKRFVKIITIFAIINFNFGNVNGEKIDFNNLLLNFQFKNWKLVLKENNKGILIELSKDKKYDVLITIMDEFQGPYDEIIPAFPIDINCEQIVLSLDDIDSFRRIEQIILKGMIMSTNSFSDCPFCGEAMTKLDNKLEEEYVCYHCRQIITKKHCNEKNKDYYLTNIDGFKPTEFVKHDAIYHYRNITKCNQVGQFICPCCQKIH